MADEQNDPARDRAIVADALDWAYRMGYNPDPRHPSGGDMKAAEAFARLTGQTLSKESLGFYGDKLAFSQPA